jgi:hypothetical protein
MIVRFAAKRESAVLASIVLLWALIIVSAPLPATDDPPPEPEALKLERAARLLKMRALAGQFDITSAAGDDSPQLELRGEPLFRYSDQPRGFLDATLWAWGPPGRPAAVAKVEAALNGKVPYWQYCVASLADGPLRIDFANQRKLTAPKAGLTLHAFPDGPPPADRPAPRQRQMKDLVARFAATIHARHLDTKELVKQEMRLLPSPIHRYADEKNGLRDGMIFGLTTNGTNPDMLIVIELRGKQDDKPEWHFGIVKMTYSEVHIRLDKSEVYSSPVSEPLETWTYFQTPREE